jgi:microcin C transport system permease protein
MGAYILRRLLLMVPTLFGIMAISFIVIQFAPGGPVEQVIARMTGEGGGAMDRISGGGADIQQSFDSQGEFRYRGAQGLDPAFIEQLERQFGFDKPPLERFFTMLWNYIRFDFGDSYLRDISVIDPSSRRCPCRFPSACGSR